MNLVKNRSIIYIPDEAQKYKQPAGKNRRNFYYIFVPGVKE